jgi:voltage-gated potassium channel Kch
MLASRDVPSVLLPLGISAATVLATVIIHAFALVTIIRLVRREQRLGRAGVWFWKDVSITAGAVLVAFTAHLLEIALWALVFVRCHEFPGFASAFYCSAENYTTLGYGDIVMSSAWKLLGPLEAADGMLMFGVSTAMIFTVIQRLVRTRFGESEIGASAPEPRPQEQRRSL